MSTQFGNYDEARVDFSKKGLCVRFIERSVGPLWAHAALTADFLADYLSTELSPELRKEARASISYLTNELVENAVKFGPDGIVELCLNQDGDAIVILMRNDMDAEDVPRFQGLLSDVLDGDPQELLIQRIEANAANPKREGSGLGFLTMMCDYEASLGWCFDLSDRPDRTTVWMLLVLPL